MKKIDENYLINKKNILKTFLIHDKSINVIIKFLCFFLKKTNINHQSLNHLFNSFLIIINYNPDDINTIRSLYKTFQNLDSILIDELVSQLNEFKDCEFNDYFDTIIFDTLSFFKKFEENGHGEIAFNILHEVLFNLLKINDHIDLDIKNRLYIEILKEIVKEYDSESSQVFIQSGKIYITTVEVCNFIVNLINDWIKYS
ncbi:hypothetical protein CPAV1605_877 [seawater metagenome]|uniref:Uncharacterized protein n=1 Tax=seawater metagenome TaxID=1561972 RepID=A0A5E8CLZ1_9ZZZZ